MSLSNCPLCGKLHAEDGLCKECLKEEENKFWLLAKHLRDNPGTTADGLVKATGLDLSLILKFLKQGRFQFSKAPGSCAHCEKPAQFGAFCADHKHELAHASLKPFKAHGRHH